MTANLSGLQVEYAIALIYSSEAGKREATLGLRRRPGHPGPRLPRRGADPLRRPARHAGQAGDQRPRRQTDHRPLHLQRRAGHVYPPQAKRLAPDLFFQQQIYRRDGGAVLLPPGEFTMDFGRGPEYRLLDAHDHRAGKRRRGHRRQAGTLDQPDGLRLLQRRPSHPRRRLRPLHQPDARAFCPRTCSCTSRARAERRLLLTWGPCYDYQRQFFEPKPHKLSEPFTLLKYDVEVSGFGSQALGHVCLLNLRDQTYPGSDGDQDQGLADLDDAACCAGPSSRGPSPATLTRPAACRSIRPRPPDALIAQLDTNKDGKLSRAEAASGLLAGDFDRPSTPTRTASSREAELTASLGSESPIGCRTWRSRR